MYEICVEGRVGPITDERMEKWIRADTPDGMTSFSGCVRDDSELYGVLACLRDRGVTIIRVNRISPA